MEEQTDTDRPPPAHNNEEQRSEQQRRREEEREQRRFRRQYKPRTCRICLETVYPTFHFGPLDDGFFPDDPPVADTTSGIARGISQMGSRIAGKLDKAVPDFLRQKPRVEYVSEDPKDGRLISPCLCKGSLRYVHEGCLRQWRNSQPITGRSFWTCPTCNFEYRLQRLQWGRWISNWFTRVLLTMIIFVFTIFALGFIADPLIRLWLEPGGTVAYLIGATDFVDDELLEELHHTVHAEGLEDTTAGWVEHFVKGILSLGVVGMLKTFLAVSPFTWVNIRGLGYGRQRRNGGARVRVEGFSWVFIVVGIITFLGAVWKGINYLSSALLERMSLIALEVQGKEDDPDDDDDDEKDEDEDENDHDDHDANAGDGKNEGSGHDPSYAPHAYASGVSYHEDLHTVAT